MAARSPGPGQRRARGRAQPHPELVGHDAGQRGLAHPGRAGEEEVVGRLPPLPGRVQQHAQVLLQLGLAHEVGQRPGAEAGLVGPVRRGAVVEHLDPAHW